MTTPDAPRRVDARRDDRLVACVVRRTALRYAGGADPGTDRPPHVRAASGVTWVGARVAVVQDDASFLALIDPATGMAEALPLPADDGGERQFDDGRGNKDDKLDLEAIVVVTGDGPPLLLALGSGSSPRRERIAVVRGLDDAADAAPDVRLVAVPRLYARLRDTPEFAGSELNVEGVLHRGMTLRLFGRGNGGTRDDAAPVNATCELDLAALLAHLEGPGAAEPPAPARVVQYDLGAIDEQPLGFTDATLVSGHPDVVLYTAAAEDSPDATRDGVVLGSAVGVVVERDGAVEARWIELCDADGAPVTCKAEGLVPDRADPMRLYVVIDVDDHERPSELLEVALRGPWFPDPAPSA